MQVEMHTQVQGDTPHLGADNPTADHTTVGGGSNQEPRAERMIGEFDDSVNALGKVARSHDEARIRTLKDDMDGVLIFADLFSAIFTAFLIDSKQGLQVSPAERTIYYL
jgi:hypothetical protein